jgi:3-phenylpropionate/trans-cinnamate dioxygenase ferredoxin reductase component
MVVAAMRTTVAIVGAGQAGLQVAATLREQGFEGELVLIGDEPHAPYQRPPLSKGYLLGELGAPQVGLRPPAYFEKQRIKLVTGKRAVGIDRARRMVQLDDGSAVAYDQLVLATGARNRPLPVPGADLRNVCFLRTLDEAEVLRARLPLAKNVVVVGAGFIGLELASAAVKHGASTSVLDIATRPLARALSRTMSSIVAREHAQLGVRLRLETQVLRFLGKGDCVSAVETVDGEVLPADLVVIGIGVVPNVELAASCGLAIDDGIVVDELLQTSDPNISAIGDVVAHPNPFASNRRVRLESVQNAADQARCVAQRILGRPAAYHAVPWFWSHQGNLKLQMAGLPSAFCEEVVRGDALSAACSVFLFHEHQLVCVESLNRPADHMLARRLLENRVDVTPQQAADLSFDLKTLLAGASQAAAE